MYIILLKNKNTMYFYREGACTIPIFCFRLKQAMGALSEMQTVLSLNKNEIWVASQ